MDLLKAQEGTIFGRVNEIFMSGKFVEPDVEVRDGEKVMGVLTDYEKALFTAIKEAQDHHNQRVHESAKGISQYPENEARTHCKNFDILINIFRASVDGRVDKNNDYKNLAVRKDFKIVAFTHPMEAVIKELAALMSGLNEMRGN